MVITNQGVGTIIQVVSMNENTTKIMAVVVVLVLVVAGIAAFLIMNNDKGKSVEIDAALEVYGNADGDYKIDSADRTIIQNIIDKKDGYTLEKYPLADANYDSNVTSADIDIVNAIIDKKSTTVWHINHTTDTTKYPSGTYVVDTKWPITKTIANGSSNSLQAFTLVNIKENIVGISYSASSPPDKILWPDYAKMESLGDSTTNIFEDRLTACLEKNPGTTAVITNDNKSSLDGAKGLSEQQLEERYHLDVVRIEHAAPEADDYCSALLLIGFLFQKESEAQAVSEWTTKVYKDISEKTDKIDKKVKATASAYYTYISGRQSDYSKALIFAGGVSPLWENTASTIYFSGDKTDPRIYEEQYQGEKIIVFRTGTGFLGASWYDDPSTWNSEKMQNQLSYYKNFEAYENKQVWHTSGDMPIVCRVIYASAILYPDLFSMEDADKLHQEFVDKFMGGVYDVSKLKFVLSQEDIEKM